jgi:hypothetical protein
MAAMFGGAPSTLSAQASSQSSPASPGSPASQLTPAVPGSPAAAGTPAAGRSGAGPEDLNALIADAARDLSDYQQLTAAGKLGEAGQKLEQLKLKLEELQRRRQ